MIKALIFDCDGVLVDTERDAHRVGFNLAFKDMGIDAEWDVDLYGRLLLVAGGKERMRAYFDEFGWPAGTEAAAAKDELILALHKTKTQITSELVSSLPVRPGILRIIDEAIAAGVRLGVCTTSNPKFIDAVLDLFGPERKAAFDFVHAGDVVAKKKPAPDIYLLALETLGLPPHECMVIEDSRNGLLAAMAPGCRRSITTSTYTVDEDFTGAVKSRSPSWATSPMSTSGSPTSASWPPRRGLRERTMTEISQADIERAIRTTCGTVLRTTLLRRSRRPRRRRRLRHLARDRVPPDRGPSGTESPRPTSARCCSRSR
jgi:HAD superfamily hydrolase (TIGR01509 family)